MCFKRLWVWFWLIAGFSCFGVVGCATVVWVPARWGLVCGRLWWLPLVGFGCPQWLFVCRGLCWFGLRVLVVRLAWVWVCLVVGWFGFDVYG